MIINTEPETDSGKKNLFEKSSERFFHTFFKLDFI